MSENIFLFVPNLIDYMRAAFAFASFYIMQTHYQIAAILYFSSYLLDEIDGYFARALNQESKFGTLLDMCIDRIATMCWLAALCHFYPKYMVFFQFSMALDIFSHWLYLHSTTLKGRSSHKVLDLSVNSIFRLYYHNRIFQSMVCVTNELFYIMLYITYFTPGPIVVPGRFSFGIYTAIMFVCAPLSVLKSGINVLQLIYASQTIAAIDASDREQMRKGQKGK